MTHHQFIKKRKRLITGIFTIILAIGCLPCIPSESNNVNAASIIKSVTLSISKITPPKEGWDKEFTNAGSFAFAKDTDVNGTSPLHTIGYSDYHTDPSKWKAAVYTSESTVSPSLTAGKTAKIGEEFTISTTFRAPIVYDQMSGIIYNTSVNNVVAYGKIGGTERGEHTFTIPSDISKGTYTLWVFLEKFNDDKADEILNIGRVSITVEESSISEQRGVTVDFSYPIKLLSGDTVQPNAGSGMTPVVVTLADTTGYYFPEDYMAEKSPIDGIYIERTAPARVQVYGTPMRKSTYIELDPPTVKSVEPHSVIINNMEEAESKGNMAWDTESGSTRQTNLTGSMKAISFKAKDGYYFAEEDYPGIRKNGVTITRLDSGEIRISGTPSADVTLTILDDLPPAREKETPDEPEFESGSSSGSSGSTGSGSSSSSSSGTISDGSSSEDSNNNSSADSISDSGSHSSVDSSSGTGNISSDASSSGTGSNAGFSVLIKNPSNSHITIWSETEKNYYQSNVTGAIKNASYYANAGYYFPTDYSVTPVNGIKVIRNGATKITVYGIPYADTVITLKPAIAVSGTTGTFSTTNDSNLTKDNNASSVAKTNIESKSANNFNIANETKNTTNENKVLMSHTVKSDEITAKEYNFNSMSLDLSSKIAWKNKRIKLKWNSIPGSDGYEIYAAIGTKNTKAKVLGAVVPDNKSSQTVYCKKVNGKAIDQTKLYQFQIKAYRIVNCIKEYTGESRVLYIAGNKSSKYTNVKKIKPARSNITIKSKKAVTIKTNLTTDNFSKKLIKDNNKCTITYISSNDSIASVNKKGKITGICKGKCVIYILANNGVKARVNVRVK